MNLNNLFSQSKLDQYAAYLRGSSLSDASLKRKLSSLASFQKFLIKNKLIENVRVEHIDLPIQNNLKPNLFSKIFKKTKLDKLSNFQLDKLKSSFLFRYLIIFSLFVIGLGLGFTLYRQAFAQSTKNFAYTTASSPTIANRQLSFQGRLTDSSGNPITSSTNIVFKLYNTETIGTGTSLYTSAIGNSQTVVPDENGIFSVVIGKTHGTEIPDSVFTENSAVYLEITAGGEVMSPRQPIATVAYALNSETLQGLPPSASGLKNTVLVIDELGNINLGETSPTIKSTSGTMGIEAQAVLIKATDGSGGNIEINPDANGIIKLTTEGSGSTLVGGFINATNANLASGNLFNATINNTNRGYNFINFSNYSVGVSTVSRFSVDAYGNTNVGGTLSTINLAVGSSDLVTNLNSDLLDGQHSTYFVNIGQTGSLPYDNYNHWDLQSNGVGNTAILSGNTVNFVNGVGISLSQIGSAITINNTSTGTTYTAGVGLTLSSLNVFSLDLANNNNWTGTQNFANNVGIGTTDPGAYKLNVNGSMNLASGQTYNIGGAQINLNNLSDVLTSTPAADQILTFNGYQWVNTNPGGVSAGAGINFYLDDSSADISTYNTLFNYPTGGTEITDSTVVNNNTVLKENYISDALGDSQIDGGDWQFDTYDFVDTTANVSEILIDVYKRNIGGTETLLFSTSTGEINNTQVALNTVISVQNSFPINATDRLVVKYSAKTTNTSDTTVSYTHNGTNHYTHIHTPLVTRHNNLAGLQGGTASEYYHLTAAEYTGSGTGTFVRQNAPIFIGGIGVSGNSTFTNNLTIGSTLTTTTLKATNAQDTTMITDLNADLLDGQHSTYFVNIGQTGNFITTISVGASGLSVSGSGIGRTLTNTGLVDITNSTLTRSGSSGTYTVGLNLGSTNTWTGLQNLSAGATISNLSTNGNASIGGTLAVTGRSTFAQNVFVNAGGIGVTGNSVFSTGATIAVLSTTGNASIGGTLAVTGRSTFAQNVFVNAGGIGVTGNSVFTNNLTIGDTLTLSQGAQNGYVLTSDASGNAKWSVGSGNTYTAGVGLTLSSTNVFSLDLTSANTWTGLQTFNATGAPFAVGSSNVVTNLNASYLNGIDSNGFIGVGSTGNFITTISVGASGLSVSGSGIGRTLTNTGLVDITNSTLTRSGSSGTYTVELNLGNVNTWTALQNLSAGATISNLSIGGTFLSVGSTNLTTNLNADLLDGYNASAFEVPLTFTNGLTRTSNDVHLGGELTENTRLNIGSTEALYIQFATGNVGIGTTNPGAKLDIFSTNTITNSYGNLFVHTSNAQAIDLGGQITLGGSYTDSGSQANFGAIAAKKENSSSGNAAGYLALSTYGPSPINGVSERMRITSAGNVGIGTTNPTHKLDVVGDAYFSTNLSIGGTFLSVGSTNLTTNLNADLLDGYHASNFEVPLTFTNGLTRTSNDIHLGGELTEDTRLNIGSTEVMYFDTSGNIGIGTTAPTESLDVVGNIKASKFYDQDNPLYYLDPSNASSTSSSLSLTTSGSIRFNSDVGGTHIVASSASRIQNFTNGLLLGVSTSTSGTVTGWDNNLFLNVSGNVGIGTTNPTAILDISSIYSTMSLPNISGTTNTALTRIGYADHTWAGVELDMGIYNGGGYPAWIQARNPADYSINRNLLLNPNGGNVGIGTTNPITKLQVAGAGTFLSPNSGTSGGVVIQDASGNPGNPILQFVNNANNTEYGYIQGLSAGGLALMGGNVGIGTTNPTESLDVIGNIKASKFYDQDNPLYFIDPANASSNNASLSLTTSGSIRFNSDVGGTHIVASSASRIQNYPNGLLLGVSTSTSGNIVGWDNNLFLNVSGNVGIGTTAPGVNFVNSGATNTSSPTLGSGTIGSNAILSNNGLYGLYTGVSDNGNVWQQVQRNDTGVSTYNLLLNPNGGKVGIGTTNPLSKLEIVSSNDPNSEIGGVTIRSSATYAKKLNLGWSDTIDAGYIAPVQSGVAWKNLIINPYGGNVGIGTTSPNSPLHVVGNLSVSGNGSANGGMPGMAQITTGGTSPFLNRLTYGTDGTGYKFAISKNQAGSVTDQLVIQDNGNVGIGTASPGAKLDVSGIVRAYSGFVGDAAANIAGTQAAAYFPNGFYAPGTYNNWIYGATHFSSSLDGITSLDASGTVYGGELYTRDNVYLGYMGNWISNLLNQSVRTDAEPSFPGIVLTGPLHGANRPVDWGDINASQYAGNTYYAYQSMCVHNQSGSCNSTGGVVLGLDNDSAFSNFPSSGTSFVGGSFNALAFRANGGAIHDSNQFYCPGSGNCHLNYSGTGVTYVGNGPGSVVLNGNTNLTAGYDLTWSPAVSGQAINSYNDYGTLIFNGPIDVDSAVMWLGNDANAWLKLTDDESINGHKSLHANSNLIGFVGGGGGWIFNVTEGGYGWFGGGHNDLAENYYVSGKIIRGSLVSVDNSSNKTVVAASSSKKTLVGIVSTAPGAVMDESDGFKIGSDTKLIYQDEKAPIALVGTVPTLVISTDGNIISGDPISVSDTPGFGTKATSAGQIVGNAIENINISSCVSVNSIDEINWPDDDSKNSLHPCYKLPNGNYVAKIMVSLNLTWHDPDITLTSTGDVNINYNVSDEVLASLGYDGAKNEIESATYSLTDSTGAIVTRISQFSEIASAKIKAGLISATNIIADNIIVKNLKSDKLTSNELLSPKANIDQLTATDIQTTSITTDELKSDTASIRDLTSEKLISKEATISTLYADNIISKEGSFGDLMTQKVGAVRDELKKLITDNEASSSAITGTSIASLTSDWSMNIASDSAKIEGDLSISNNLVIGAKLLVNGDTQLANAFITGTFSAGEVSIKDNFIQTTNTALYIQPSNTGSIHMMGDTLVIAENGEVQINGNLAVSGSLFANLITASEIQTQKLTATEINSNQVKIATDSAQTIIADPGFAALATSSTNLTSNATAGTASLPAGKTEIVINNNKITNNSMVYITPVGSTKNQVPYIKAKVISTSESYFTIALDNPLDQDIEINWWIIN